MARRYLETAAALAVACHAAHAEAGADGVLSLRSEAWSGDRDLSGRSGIAAVSAWGRGRLDAGSAGQFVANGWLRAQTPDSARNGRVRELYWRRTLGPAELKLGRQMVVWGRADGLNPTDNLSPRDFRLLAPEDGDLRHGNEAAQLEIAAPGDSVVSLLWFPRAASHTVPLESMPGVIYRSEPARGRQWAVKWDFNAMPDADSGIDGSLSFFHGVDPMPDLTPGSLSPAGFEVVLRNQPLSVLGGDLSMSRKGVIWRAEAALMRTGSRGEADFQHKRPQLWMVGGGEWSLPAGTTLGLQATVRHVFHHRDPDQLAEGPLRELAWRQLAASGQTARNQAGILWRLARRLRNDTLTLESSGVALWSNAGGGRSNGLIRLRADVSLNDQWQLQFGGDRYFGIQRSPFGQLRDNSLVYLQLRYGV